MPVTFLPPKCCGEVITDKIISDVKENKFFTILADEASDISGKEQMSLVLRFVDKSCHIREDLIKFIHCKEGLSGKYLSDSILSTLADLGLDIYNCRGQGYDGAGAVAGRINGCSAHILRLNDKALYCHFSSHRLNLAISSACTVQSIRNVLDQVKEIS